MSANDVLVTVRDNLKEASTELVEKFNSLEQQLTEQGADPALLSEIKDLSTNLKDIVPNAVDADPDVTLPE